MPLIYGCAYFNTFYNAEQYFDEANKLRLEKDGEDIPITAMDKYGKAIQKCQIVLKEYPESKFRIEAILLMSKARYYRKDYEIALIDLNQIEKEGNKRQIEEASYWRSLCKWKKGNLQTGKNELEDLLKIAKSKNIIAKCHLSLAEIAKELNDHKLALIHLKKGAKYSTNRDEKGVLYGRLAEMAFDKKNYDLAEEAYLNVISNSLSKENIENAHLQILKIYRIQKKYRSASRKIKGMLIDDKFNRIAGSLELELVQLYKAQGEMSEIETRLESIVNDYQRTPVSAEAYFQLGEIYTSEKWNLEKAQDYFNSVTKESSKSLFSPMAKSRSKSISVYQEAQKDLETYKNINIQEETKDTSKIDSVGLSVSLITPKRSQAELYYQIADLEAFTFQRYKESINHLDHIISNFPDSEYKPKSIFALAFIYESMGDSVTAKNTRMKIIKEFPSSEYASYLNKNLIVANNSQENSYREAELVASNNITKAIKSFKVAFSKDENGDLAAPAAYSIGYYYDQEAKIDSALKYYQLVKENYPDSEQNKQASKRILTLNNVLSQISNDTLKIEEQEQN